MATPRRDPTSTRPTVAAAVVIVAVLTVLTSRTSASAASPGPQTVTYGGMSLRVPAGWPTYDLAREPGRCVRLDVPAVYLGHEGPEARCPARAVGRTTAVQLEPLDAAVAVEAARATLARVIAGRRVRVAPAAATTHSIEVAVDQPGILATISFGPDRRQADQILDTLAAASSTPTPRQSPTTATPRPSATSPTSRPTPGRPTSRPSPSPPPQPQPNPPFVGLGFDTCAAPSAADMQAWLSSSYRAVGVYIGGANRACPDGNLSPSWVTAVEGQGWSLIPTYVGLQAPCTSGFATIDPGQAAAQGAVSAVDAAGRARDFGLGPGTAIYFDMEAYEPVGGPCSSIVTTFLTTWSAEIHRQGYVPGVYGSLESVLVDLVNTPSAQPDQIWFAYWDGVAGTGHPAIPAGVWPSHQRIKQYLGGHDDTHGGVTLNIDSNAVDATLRAAPPPPPTPSPSPTSRPSPSPSPRPSPRPSVRITLLPRSPY